jgi:putative nucleotidyltransferase-like protein
LSRRGARRSFWPTTTQRALLEVALGPVELAAERWQELQPLDVEALEPGGFSVLPPLYERLKETVPSDPQLPRLLGIYRNVWYRNQLLLDRLGVLLPLLRQRARVEPVLAGGMSAVLRWYPRLGLRPAAQLELIVEREAAPDAIKVAGFAGWRPTSRTGGLTRLRDPSDRVLVVHHGAPSAVAAPLGSEGMRAFRERAVELEGVEGKPLVLHPADELILLCAVGARTTFPPTCQWLIDAHNLLHSAERPPAEALVERSARFHLAEPLRATLAYLTDVSESAALYQYLAPFDARPASRRDLVAFRLAGVGSSSLVGPAQMLAAHLQATGDESLARVVTQFPHSLRETWGASSALEVPVLGVRKAARLLSRPAQRPGSTRSRSASS